MAVGRVACEQPRRALVIGSRQNAVGDDRGGKLEDLLDADGHGGGSRAVEADRLLREQRVHAVAEQDDLCRDLILARLHAADLAGLIAHELFDGDAVDELRALVLGPRGEPLIEHAAQHSVGLLPFDVHGVGGEVDGEVSVGREHGDALVRDLSLERRLLLEIGKHLAKRVGVDASAGHVLGAGEIAALHDQDALARLREFVSSYRARAACADDDSIEICHVIPFSSD